jgi:NAD(P)-dependent dehydrogenase (short-subunit alcohol dehydrogenase family)
MVSPGWVMTEKQLREHVTEKDKEDLLRDQSLKQLITPEQIAPPILFLLSGAASAITGQNLVVDNGKYMQ